jgi:UDP-glucose 4-epimerase
MEKILITGLAGFIGSHVARRFLKEGYCVVGVDDLSGGNILNVPDGIDFIQGDLAKEETIARLPRDCRRILHLAGQSSGEISFDNPVADLHKNTVSTLNLIRYGIEIRAERIVYASSMSVYGAVEDAPINERRHCQPLSCYGVGKLASEGYLRVYQDKLPFVALRMFNVYGPGQDMSNLRQGMVSIYLAQAIADGTIHVKGSLERFRDFIYIDDVVEIWQRTATDPAALVQTLNVGTGIKTTVQQLLDRVCALVPNSSYYTQGSTPGDQNGIYADISELKARFGIDRFTSLDEGLREFVTKVRDQKPKDERRTAG